MLKMTCFGYSVVPVLLVLRVLLMKCNLGNLNFVLPLVINLWNCELKVPKNLIHKFSAGEWIIFALSCLFICYSVLLYFHSVPISHCCIYLFCWCVLCSKLSPISSSLRAHPRFLTQHLTFTSACHGHCRFQDLYPCIPIPLSFDKDRYCILGNLYLFNLFLLITAIFYPMLYSISNLQPWWASAFVTKCNPWPVF